MILSNILSKSNLNWIKLSSIKIHTNECHNKKFIEHDKACVNEQNTLASQTEKGKGIFNLKFLNVQVNYEFTG